MQLFVDSQRSRPVAQRFLNIPRNAPFPVIYCQNISAVLLEICKEMLKTWSGLDFRADRSIGNTEEEHARGMEWRGPLRAY